MPKYRIWIEIDRYRDFNEDVIEASSLEEAEDIAKEWALESVSCGAEEVEDDEEE